MPNSVFPLSGVRQARDALRLSPRRGTRPKCSRSGLCLAAHLPSVLAESLAQRNGGFTNANTPRPTPYYRFVIKSHREGFITRTIIWVPSRKLWFDKEYVTPPLARFWRTDQVSLRSRLMAFVRNLNPHQAPAKWSSVLPK